MLSAPLEVESAKNGMLYLYISLENNICMLKYSIYLSNNIFLINFFKIVLIYQWKCIRKTLNKRYMIKDTLILPANDKAASRKMLLDAIHENPIVLFIVLGTSEQAKKTVERADKASEDPERHVIWAMKPDHVLDILQTLNNETGYPNSTNPSIDWTRDIMVVVSSLGDTLRFVQYHTGKPMDMLDIEISYSLGSK